MQWTEQQAEAVGEWIVEARKRLHGWTREELALAAGKSPNGVGRLETATQGPQGPYVKTVSAIEDALQVPRGTLQRVADGEDIDPMMVTMSETNGQVLDQVNRLVGLVRESREEQAALHAQLDDLARRLAELEQRVADA